MAGKKKTKKVNPIPKGYHTVSAELNLNDAAAQIEFCKQAFGAKVRSKMPGPNGKIMHAEVVIGDSIMMFSDAMRDPARTQSLFLYVPNVDKTLAKAVKAGAEVLSPAADMFWGDRFARLKDPQGNLWSLGTHIEDVTPAELKKRVKAMASQMGSQ